MDYQSLLDLLNQWQIEETGNPFDNREEAIIQGTLEGFTYKKMKSYYPSLKGLNVSFIARYLAFHLRKKLTCLFLAKNILDPGARVRKSTLWTYVDLIQKKGLISNDNNLEHIEKKVDPFLDKILLQRYCLTEDLVSNEFSTTYLAEDQGFSSPSHCIVKRFHIKSEAIQKRYKKEAWCLQKLSEHPQIPNLLADFQEDEYYYLVYQFIEGKFLSEKIMTDQPFSEKAVIDFLTNILNILDFVHQKDIIHREINPSNLILQELDNKIFLVDFGGIKEIINNNYYIYIINNSHKYYLAPEQATGCPRFSSDIYSVGKIALQLLTGQHPRQLRPDPNTLNILCTQYANVSPHFALILDKMVCYDFRERYCSVGEVLTALRELEN
jgi:hypothetical protein